MKLAYLATSSSIRPTVTGRPLCMVHMSGFWQYWQRSGQPDRYSMNRMPGPLTDPVIS